MKFNRILLPIDGSKLSVTAAQEGIKFAKMAGAEVLALYVTQPISSVMGFDSMAKASSISSDEYEKSANKVANQHVQKVIEFANEQGVTANGSVVCNYNVAEGVVKQAKESDCDLIFIGSHGRSGVSKLLLGSVASKVLSLANINVFVYRADK